MELQPKVKIIDLGGKEREVLLLKRITHQIPDVIGGGIAVASEYVEVVIKGNFRVWTQWYPLAEFRERNPTVVI